MEKEHVEKVCARLGEEITNLRGLMMTRYETKDVTASLTIRFSQIRRFISKNISQSYASSFGLHWKNFTEGGDYVAWANNIISDGSKFLEALLKEIRARPDEVIDTGDFIEASNEMPDSKKEILNAVLLAFIESGNFPDNDRFRVKYKTKKNLISELVQEHFLTVNNDKLELRLSGLLQLDSPEKEGIVQRCNELIPHLQAAYEEDPKKELVVADLAQKINRDPNEVSRDLFFLVQLYFYRGMSGFLPTSIKLGEEILDIESLESGFAEQERTKVRNHALMHGRPSLERKFPFTPSKNVFIIHGHDEINRNRLDEFVKGLGLNPIVLARQPNLSQALVEKLEREGKNVSYAICLMTPDDCIKPKNLGGAESFQPRPNVIFELGWFFAHLERERVCIFEHENISLHSDIRGITTCRFRDSVEEKFEELKKELRAVGLLQ